MKNNNDNKKLDKETIDNMDKDALSEAKIWLFKENMRLLEMQRELDEKSENLEKEEQSLRKELSEEMKKLKVRESQLILEKKHVDDRLNILRRGFEELNADKAAFEAEKRNLKPQSSVRISTDGFVFFRGVDTRDKLKKRYKELLKIYHPDNSGGDEGTVHLIRSEYEELEDIL